MGNCSTLPVDDPHQHHHTHRSHHHDGGGVGGSSNSSGRVQQSSGMGESEPSSPMSSSAQPKKHRNGFIESNNDADGGAGRYTQERDDTSTSHYRRQRSAVAAADQDQTMTDCDDSNHATNAATPLVTERMRQQQANVMMNVVKHGADAFDPFLSDQQQQPPPQPPGVQQQQQVQYHDANMVGGQYPPNNAAQFSPHHQQPQYNALGPPGPASQERNVYPPTPHHKAPQPDARFSYNGRDPPSSSQYEESRQPEEEKEEHIVLPPDSAVRTRCYRLNLEQPSSPLSDAQGGGYPAAQGGVGPIEYTPPPHHLPSPHRDLRVHSWHATNTGMVGTLQTMGSDDSSACQSDTQIAVSTAKIFRGITVDKNGTILSQNARASRSNRGKEGKKQVEKSRQSAKIDKAKDLVDDALEGGLQDGDEPSKMVSLVIMGEYDDMKHLVRDGSKKLRDAENLPDDALLAINRPRTMSASFQSSSFGAPRNQYPVSPPPLSPTRKRLGSAGQLYHSPARSRYKAPHNQNSHNSVPQSAPPKLKGHPRDRPSSRRLDRDGADGGASGRRFLPVRDNCQMFGGGHSDWSEALGFSVNSIWNCGATGGNGTISPRSMTTSPVDHRKMQHHHGGGRGMANTGHHGMQHSPPQYYEGRNESNNFERMSRGKSRGSNGTRVGASERVDAPGRSGVNDTVLV